EVGGPGATAGDGEQVSSTRLRALLQAGDMPRARALLGRPYALRGRVVVGDRLGRTLGFPTANLHLRAGLLLPPDGVYAVGVEVDGRAQEGVLNIGVRPTFAGKRRSIEVHLLDFTCDLYGRCRLPAGPSPGLGPHPGMARRVEVVAPTAAAGTRLDRFLATIPEVGTRSQAKRLIDTAHVWVDGAPRKSAHLLGAGARL